MPKRAILIFTTVDPIAVLTAGPFVELQERHEHWEVGQKQTYKAESEKKVQKRLEISGKKLCNDNARNSNNKRDNTGSK